MAADVYRLSKTRSYSALSFKQKRSLRMRRQKMTDRASSRPSLVRATVLFMGASIFAYLFAVTVHEFAHYLVAIILGVPEKGIVLHPFDLSYNRYAGDLSRALGTPLRRAFSGVSGPLLNMLLGVIVSLLLWRKRSSRWIPILMWGSIALIQESVNMIGGIMDYPDIISDWVYVMLAGVSPLIVGLLAVVILITGCIWMLLLLPLAGVRPEDAFWKKLLIILSGIPMLLLGAVVYVSLLGSSTISPASLVLQRRITALVASLILLVGIAALHKPLFPILDRISHSQPAQLSWRDTLPAVGLGVTIFVLQLVFFN